MSTSVLNGLDDTRRTVGSDVDTSFTVPQNQPTWDRAQPHLEFSVQRETSRQLQHDLNHVSWKWRNVRTRARTLLTLNWLNEKWPPRKCSGMAHGRFCVTNRCAEKNPCWLETDTIRVTSLEAKTKQAAARPLTTIAFPARCPWKTHPRVKIYRTNQSPLKNTYLFIRMVGGVHGGGGWGAGREKGGGGHIRGTDFWIINSKSKRLFPVW